MDIFDILYKWIFTIQKSQKLRTGRLLSLTVNVSQAKQDWQLGQKPTVGAVSHMKICC